MRASPWRGRWGARPGQQRNDCMMINAHAWKSDTLARTSGRSASTAVSQTREAVDASWLAKRKSITVSAMASSEVCPGGAVPAATASAISSRHRSAQKSIRQRGSTPDCATQPHTLSSLTPGDNNSGRPDRYSIISPGCRHDRIQLYKIKPQILSFFTLWLLLNCTPDYTKLRPRHANKPLCRSTIHVSTG